MSANGDERGDAQAAESWATQEMVDTLANNPIFRGTMDLVAIMLNTLLPKRVHAFSIQFGTIQIHWQSEDLASANKMVEDAAERVDIHPGR